MKGLTAREAIDLIQKEIDWSKENKSMIADEKWLEGYFQGLSQAAFLIAKFDKVLREDR